MQFTFPFRRRTKEATPVMDSPTDPQIERRDIVAGEVFAKLKSTHRLPTPPGVGLKILQVARKKDATVREIAQLLKADPAISARILRFVNSPLTGIRNKVLSIDQSVALLGIREVQLVALSFSLISMTHKQSCPSFNFDSFWSESLLRASAAKKIGELIGSSHLDESFIAGLLSHIGQLALATTTPEQYEEVLTSARTTDETIAEAEVRIIGLDQSQIGSRLLASWNLPQVIWASIDQYPTANQLSNETEEAHVSSILYASELVTRVCNQSADYRDAFDELQSILPLSEDTWTVLFSDVLLRWQEFGSILSLPTGEQQSLTEIREEANELIMKLRALEFDEAL